MVGGKITLVIGLPRSGKDTWIEWAREKAVVVSPDKIRLEIFGRQFFKPAESFVWGICCAMARLLVTQGFDICVSATNTTVTQRLQWIRLAKELEVSIHLHWIDTPLQECLIRNENSSKDQRLPVSILERMARLLEPPSKSEGFTTVHRWRSAGNAERPEFWKG